MSPALRTYAIAVARDESEEIIAPLRRRLSAAEMAEFADDILPIITAAKVAVVWAQFQRMRKAIA